MPQLQIKDISPCEMIWDYGGTPQHLSPVLGTVSLKIEDQVEDVFEENYGNAPVDTVFSGTIVTLEAPFTRSVLAQIAIIFGYEDMGSQVGNVTTFKNVAGCDMYTNAVQVVIAPLCNNVPNADPNTWILLYKVHLYRAFDLMWDRSSQRVFRTLFKVFPNQDSGYCGEYGTYGVESGATPITGIC